MKKLLLSLSLTLPSIAMAQIADEVTPTEMEVTSNPTPELVRDFIATGAYKEWNHREFERSAAGGAHRSHVRTYFNEILEASILAGNTQHPAGSMAVKELYSGNDIDNDFTGYAISIKNVDNGSVSGNNWFWLEGFNPDIAVSTRNLGLFGNGNRTCTGCHSGANFGNPNNGGDFVLVRPPVVE